MGRQIAIAMGREDEKAFLDFLRSICDFRLLESFAPEKDLLWKDAFEDELEGHYFYDIWNTAFAFSPVYQKNIHGHYYVANTGDAPLVEFGRSNLQENRPGRLYWSKYFSAPEGLFYDVDAFSLFYDTLVKWVKKNAAGKVKDAWITYYLPEAWRFYQISNQSQI